MVPNVMEKIQKARSKVIFKEGGQTVWNSDNLLLVPVSSAESIHSLLSIVLHYLGFNLPSIPFKPSHNVLGNDNDNVGLFERGRSTTHTVPEI